MKLYKVRISLAARADMVELRKFLKAMMTVEGAVRYANDWREVWRVVRSLPGQEGWLVGKI